MVVRRGGRVTVANSFLGLTPVPCGAIYNQGALTIRNTTVAGKRLSGNREWNPEPGAVIIYSNGGTFSHQRRRYRQFYVKRRSVCRERQLRARGLASHD